MYKSLYIAFDLSVRDYKSSGVYKKIKGQQNAFEKLGYPCDLLFINDNQIYYDVDGVGKTHICDDITYLSLCKGLSINYDFVYIRMGLGYKRFQLMLDTLKNTDIKTIMEIPTYPFTTEMIAVAKSKWKQREYKKSLSTVFATLLFKLLYFPNALSKIDLCVTISNPIKLKQNNCININNGIDIDNIEMIKNRNNEEFKEIHALIVANLSVWHGVDLVIRSMANFYRNSENEIVLILDIVGDGEQKKYLVDLVHTLNLEKYVKFHGKKFGIELKEKYEKSNFAIGSLALYRINCKHSSTLKSREYCIQGIPFVVSDIDEMYGLKDGIFVIQSNGSNLNFDDIISWYNSLDLPATAEYMKNFAQKNFSWESEMKKVIDRLNFIN